MSRSHCRKRNPLFTKPWFPDDVIIRCVHWYLRFKLSYRDLAQIMGEVGVFVTPFTILCWVIRYSVDFAECWRCHDLAVPILALRRNLYQGGWGNGCIFTARWTHAEKRWNRI